MIKFIAMIAIFLLLSINHGRAEDATTDDDYTIGKIEINGRLRIKSFYGPPNYGELPKTDSHQMIHVLVVEGGRTIDDIVAHKKHTSNIAWFRVIGDWDQLDKLANKCVLVKGVLQYATVGADHTPLVIEADEIKEDKNDCYE